jgi:hypothetical protein
MIFRVNLPHEDDFLDADDNARGDLERAKLPMKKEPCSCSWCPLNQWAMVLSGVFVYNNL